MMMKQQTKINIQKTGILAAVYLFFRFLLPLILPFFLAWLTVRLLVFLQKKIRMRLLPMGICCLLLFLLLAGAGIFCGFYLLYEPCRDLIPTCKSYWEQFSEYLIWIPESLSGHLWETAPSVFSCLFGLFLYMISVLLFAKDWDRFHAMLKKLPFAEPVSHAGSRIARSFQRWIQAQFKIMLVISIECAAGYFLLQIPVFWFWAILTGFVDALPVFGTGTIFFPWILIVLLQGNYPLAGWLALLYLATWLTRELLEPKLLGDGLGLLPVCFLMSVIVGLKLFGTLGLFSGPFGVLLVKELWAELEMWAPPKNL